MLKIRKYHRLSDSGVKSGPSFDNASSVCMPSQSVNTRPHSLRSRSTTPWDGEDYIRIGNGVGRGGTRGVNRDISSRWATTRAGSSLLRVLRFVVFFGLFFASRRSSVGACEV